MYGFSFTPKSDTEISEIKNKKLLQDGNYPFTVKSIMDEISQAGNKQLKIIIEVIDGKFESRNIPDYLGASDAMAYKLKHFCETIGLEKEYSAADVKSIIEKGVGRSGIVKIGIKKGNMRQDGTPFDDSNTVRDYIKGEIEQKKPVEIDPTLNDDINF
jgi:hypothetical protein